MIWFVFQLFDHSDGKFEITCVWACMVYVFLCLWTLNIFFFQCKEIMTFKWYCFSFYGRVFFCIPYFVTRLHMYIEHKSYFILYPSVCWFFSFVSFTFPFTSPHTFKCLFLNSSEFGIMDCGRSIIFQNVRSRKVVDGVLFRVAVQAIGVRWMHSMNLFSKFSALSCELPYNCMLLISFNFTNLNAFYIQNFLIQLWVLLSFSCNWSLNSWKYHPIAFPFSRNSKQKFNYYHH